MRAGLSPYEALRCGTFDAARFLGETDEWGSVAAGRRADLLLLRSDPLLDVGAIRQLDLVCIGGRIVAREDLERMLTERIERVSKPPEIAEPELETPTSGAAIREGRLHERINGSELGKLAYRHARLTDGDVLIEEHAQTFDGSTSRRVRIASNGALREGEWRTSRPHLGDEWLRISTNGSGGYDVQRQDADGYSDELRLTGDRPSSSAAGSQRPSCPTC